MVNDYHCVIQRIVDGDTIYIDIDLGFDAWLINQKIRLIGIDAPESYTSDEVEEKFGEYSTEYVNNHLKVGEQYTYRSVKFVKGRFGRYLGDFIVYDEDTGKPKLLTEIMLRDHVAVPYSDDDEEMEELHMQNREILIEEGKVNI